MTTDDRLIQMMQDTIEKCEAVKQPPAKPLIPTYQIFLLAFFSVTIGPTAFYYSYTNQTLKQEITALHAQIKPVSFTPHRPKVRFDDFTVRPNNPAAKCGEGLIQQFDNQVICTQSI